MKTLEESTAYFRSLIYEQKARDTAAERAASRRRRMTATQCAALVGVLGSAPFIPAYGWPAIAAVGLFTFILCAEGGKELPKSQHRFRS